MKKRILTALVGIPIIVAVVLLAPIWVSGVLLGLLCAAATYEFMRCANPRISPRIAFWAMSAAFAMPFWLSVRGEGASLYTLSYWLFFILFLELMFSFRREERLDLTQLMAGMTAGIVMPMMLSSLIRIGLRADCGRQNMLLPFVISFSCDSGAFFTGRAWGKHKLASHLSPHKTKEGALGGLVCGTLGALGYGAVLSACHYSVHYPILLFYGIAGSVFCELGDLAFSAAKRIGGIKDYGSILPGHGGVLDRFDSMYFTAPLIEILTFWFPAVG